MSDLATESYVSDLDMFSHIVPCGIADRGVTSMLHVLGKAPPVSEVADRLVPQFGEVFGREIRLAGGNTLPASRSIVV